MRLIFTSPDERLPYSAEGMPRTISTLSMLSVEMVRMSTPRLVVMVLAAGEVASLTVSPSLCRPASVLMGAPSTRNSVPSAEMA